MSVNAEIKRMRDWKEAQLLSIRQINGDSYKRILLTACIDAFAQNQNRAKPKERQIPGNLGKRIFSDFLQNYIYTEPYKTILRLTCPTTLYYDSAFLQKNEPLRFDLKLHKIYFATDQYVKDEAERLLSILSLNKDADFENMKTKHQYSSLIYQMRNKLIHEMILLGCQANFLTEDSDPIPHMVVMSKHENSALVPYRYTLHIPIKFLELCLDEAADNYLNECEEQQRKPLVDFCPQQRHIFSFYD